MIKSMMVRGFQNHISALMPLTSIVDLHHLHHLRWKSINLLKVDSHGSPSGGGALGGGKGAGKGACGRAFAFGSGGIGGSGGLQGQRLNPCHVVCMPRTSRGVPSLLVQEPTSELNTLTTCKPLLVNEPTSELNTLTMCNPC